MKYIKLKKFCIANKSKNKMKRKPNDWEKIFTNDTSNKGLVFKTYKELIQLQHQ